jgi:hypothetical protein
MPRHISCWAAVGLLVAAAGCHMCAHPYDNCGPLWTGPNCGPCPGPLTRADSILPPGTGPGAAGPEASVVPVYPMNLLERYEQPAPVPAASPSAPAATSSVPVESTRWAPRAGDSIAR